MNTPNPNPSPEVREAIAQIIDPGAWFLHARSAGSAGRRAKYQNAALRKADAVFAALSSQTLPAPGEVELRERVAVLERENLNYAKTMEIIGQLPPAPVEAGPERQAVIERGRDALRYLLNWSTTGSRVSTIMKTFTFDGDEKITTGQRLEELWSTLNDSPTLATVAAANDEGVARIIDPGAWMDHAEFTRKSAEETGRERANEWLAAAEQSVAKSLAKAAAIRLLSQGVGK